MFIDSCSARRVSFQIKLKFFQQFERQEMCPAKHEKISYVPVTALIA